MDEKKTDPSGYEPNFVMKDAAESEAAENQSDMPEDPAKAAAPPGDDQQQHRRCPLADGQAHIKGDSRQGKQHQADKIQGDVGTQDVGELFVQGCSLPQAYKPILH